MLSSGHHISTRRVHDHDASFGGCRNVHIIKPDTGPPYHFQPSSGLEEILGHLRSTPYGQCLVVFYDGL